MAKRKTVARQLHIVDPGPEGETAVDGASPLLFRTIDRFLAVHRPVVLAHLHSVQKRNPGANNADVAQILERRYLTAITAGGAAVGAVAMIPAVGTGASLALSAAETAGFLETTALFAQSMTEVHGIALADQQRARALVMTLVLGEAGTDLVRQFADQAVGAGPGRSDYWGQLITSGLPQIVVGPLVQRLRTRFVTGFAAKEGASVFARVIPFGVGAAIGGIGNHMMGRRIVESARSAFGEPPLVLTEMELPDGSHGYRAG
jgi:hypothetical protein